MNAWIMIWLVLVSVGAIERPIPMGHRSLDITECDVKEIYSRVEVDRGTKVIDGYNSVSDAEALLVPTGLDVGNYEVEVKRLDQNFYQIVGTSIVLETQSCFAYASYPVDAILMARRQ